MIVLFTSWDMLSSLEGHLLNISYIVSLNISHVEAFNISHFTVILVGFKKDTHCIFVLYTMCMQYIYEYIVCIFTFTLYIYHIIYIYMYNYIYIYIPRVSNDPIFLVDSKKVYFLQLNLFPLPAPFSIFSGIFNLIQSKGHFGPPVRQATLIKGLWRGFC